MKRSGSWMCAGMMCGALLLTTPEPVAAQDAAPASEGRRGGDRGGRSGRGIPVFAAALSLPDLTPEQKTQIEKLQTESQAKMQELREKARSGDGATTGTGAASGGDRSSRRGGWGGPEIQKMMADAKTQVEAVLNDAQKKELEKKLEEQRARWGNRGRETSGTQESR